MKGFANSRSIEAPAETTMQLLGSWLEVLQKKTSDKDGLDVSVSTGMYLGHCIAFPSLHLYISVHPFNLPESLVGQWELQRNLDFEVFPFSPWKTSRINENI